MSEKLERVARRMIDEVWNRGNLNVIPELFTNDHINNDPVNQARGLEGLRQVVSKYRTALPDCRLDIDECLSAGDNAVVLRWRYTGTQRGQLEGIAPTGRVVNGTGITLLRFEGERIRESQIQWDALGLMQQLGVVTLPGRVATAGA